MRRQWSSLSRMENLVMATPERSVVEAVDQMTEAPSTEPIPARTFQVKNLSIWYAEKRAIDDVTLDIASNAVTAIIGPSGCGKSTFIRADRKSTRLNSSHVSE